jgi:type III restriction enzyme
MNLDVNAIANRLSLRPPQRDSLEILARVTELIALDKVVSGSFQLDVGTALRTIQSEFKTVTDFERDFPSLCFALATEVQKKSTEGEDAPITESAKPPPHAECRGEDGSQDV